jgi:DNA-binding transcriptional LysR family regulator
MSIYSEDSPFHQLDLSLLRYFFTIASHGGFSRASRATGISQPALSVGLKKLEKTLGVTLALRGDKKFALTKPGLSLFTFCQRLEANLDSTLNSIRSEQSGAQTPRRKLRVGTALSIGFGPFVSLCLDNARNRKFMEVEMSAQNTFQLLNDISEGTLDAALVPNDVYDNRLCLKKLWSDRVVFVVSKIQQKTYNLQNWKEMITSSPLITYPRETPMRSLVERFSAHHGLKFETVYSANSVDALKLLVSRKIGGAFILRSLVNADELNAQGLVIVKLPVKLPKTGVSLATRAGEHDETIAEAIQAALQT